MTGRTGDGTGESVLIRPVSLDGAIRATREWSAADDALSQTCATLDEGIRASRADLAAAGCSPAEQPGQPATSAGAAASAMTAARSNLAQAVRSRADAAALLAEAKRGAEEVLVQARDVSLARWVLGGLILLLLYLRMR